MSVHLFHEMKKLNRMVVTYSDMIEDALDKAIKALLKRDKKKAKEVVANDKNIDQMEIYIEEECLKMLALYQPVASDLRYIVAVLKMNNDLERIGDLAANIAKTAVSVGDFSDDDVPFDLEDMALRTRKLFKKCLSAMINLDVDTAKEVIEKDDRIDKIHAANYGLINKKICKNPDDKHVAIYINMLSVSRNLERIGDHATNIAEDVIYTADGDIVRHTDI
jgi:phosphate transport system protein